MVIEVNMSFNFGIFSLGMGMLIRTECATHHPNILQNVLFSDGTSANNRTVLKTFVPPIYSVFKNLSCEKCVHLL